MAADRGKSARVPGDAAITIGSLNLHCGLSSYGQPFDVPAALRRLDADIIAVQEAWWTANGAAAEGAGPEGAGAEGARAEGAGAEGARAEGADGADDVAAAARALGARLIRTRMSAGATLAELSIAPLEERGNWGLAVLSRLPVTAYETVDLGRAPADLVNRVALICSVTTPGGRPLRLVNTHLTPRFTSPGQLYRLAQHLARTPAPTVIVGDLNMPRLATWVAAGFAPTVRGRTFPAERPVIQLDHLLAGAGVAWWDAEVLPPVGSDHLPIRARLRLS